MACFKMGFSGVAHREAREGGLVLWKVLGGCSAWLAGSLQKNMIWMLLGVAVQERANNVSSSHESSTNVSCRTVILDDCLTSDE